MSFLALFGTAFAGTTVLDEGASSFGDAVSGVGDVDGDGYDDLVVGDPLGNRAFFYRGGPLGIDTAPAAEVAAVGGSAFFGARVAGGDVNGDGFADVIVTASNDETVAVNGGSVSVYLGSTLGLSPTPADVVYGAEDQYLGASVAMAGDVNGDGYDDVLVGSTGLFGSERAGAWLYAGSSSGALSLLWSARGSFRSEYGGTVAADDLDGDGFVDLIVGARSDGPGRVYVYGGSAAGPSATPTWTLEGFQSRPDLAANFGLSVAAVGDLDLDGFPDLAVVGENAEGKGVHLFAGSSNGPVEVARIGDLSASDVSAADANGDGWPDLFVGSRIWNGLAGKAEVYLGSEDGLASLPSRSTAGETNGMGSGDLLGGDVTTLGDVDGDGYDDLAAGGSGRFPGRVWVIGGRPDARIAVGPASPGGSVRVDVSSALPGDRVVVTAAAGGPVEGRCPVEAGGLCLSTGRPSIARSGVADASGAATIRVPLPAGTPVGSAFTVQAVLVRDAGWISAELSVPVASTVGP